MTLTHSAVATRQGFYQNWKNFRHLSVSVGFPKPLEAHSFGSFHLLASNWPPSNGKASIKMYNANSLFDDTRKCEYSKFVTNLFSCDLSEKILEASLKTLKLNMHKVG